MNSKTRITFPTDVYRLEEINLPFDLEVCSPAKPSQWKCCLDRRH
jgi:hypothetical protein